MTGRSARDDFECKHFPSLAAVSEGDDGDLTRVRVCEVANEIVDLVEGMIARVERLIGRWRNGFPTHPAPGPRAWGRRRTVGVGAGRSPAVDGVVASALGECGREEVELRRSHGGVWEVDVDVRMAYLP
jgi:hypothetical protein